MKRIVTAIFIMLICSQAWADVWSFLTANTYSRNIFVGAGAGELFNSVGHTNNYLATGSGWPDDHYVSNSVANQPYGFVTGGYAWMRPDNWLPGYSLGLRYMYVPSFHVSGYIDQYSVPTFRNYNFNYDVQLLNLLAAFKVDIYRWYNLMPYVMLGAGVTNYSTSDYSEQALSGVTPRVSPGFGDGSGNNIAYQAGIGLDYAMRENMWLNLEFNYTDYGMIYTGKGANYATLTGTNYDNELLKNTLTATSVFLGITYYPA